MMDRNKVVFGIYKTRGAVERAVEALRADGFRTTDISVLLPDSQGSQELANVKTSKAPEGAATGVVTGGVIGGTLGVLAGIGALAIPGIGPFIAAGPIMAALAGAGVGGAVGGISGALIGYGVPEYEAKRYEGYVRKGGILLSVHTEDAEWLKRAKNCLESTGAEDVASASESEGDFKGAFTTSRQDTDKGISSKVF